MSAGGNSRAYSRHSVLTGHSLQMALAFAKYEMSLCPLGNISGCWPLQFAWSLHVFVGMWVGGVCGVVVLIAFVLSCRVLLLCAAFWSGFIGFLVSIRYIRQGSPCLVWCAEC